MTNTVSQIVLRNVIGPDSAWFWTMIQGIAVTITLILIYRQLVAQRFSNILSSVATLDERWNAPEMRKTRKALCAKHGGKDRSISQQDGLVLDFFEQMGLYLKKGVFTVDILWDLYSYYVEHYWQIAEPLITEYRSHTKDKTWYTAFESLRDRLQKESQRRGVRIESKTQEEIKQFIKGENEKV